MTDEQKNESGMEKNEKEEQKASRNSVFAGIYDQLPDISIRSLDRFILFCVLALVAVILIGILKANHVF